MDTTTPGTFSHCAHLFPKMMERSFLQVALRLIFNIYIYLKIRCFVIAVRKETYTGVTLTIKVAPKTIVSVIAISLTWQAGFTVRGRVETLSQAGPSNPAQLSFPECGGHIPIPIPSAQGTQKLGQSRGFQTLPATASTAS